MTKMSSGIGSTLVATPAHPPPKPPDPPDDDDVMSPALVLVIALVLLAVVAVVPPPEPLSFGGSPAAAHAPSQTRADAAAVRTKKGRCKGTSVLLPPLSTAFTSESYPARAARAPPEAGDPVRSAHMNIGNGFSSSSVRARGSQPISTGTS